MNIHVTETVTDLSCVPFLVFGQLEIKCVSTRPRKLHTNAYTNYILSSCIISRFVKLVQYSKIFASQMEVLNFSYSEILVVDFR